MATIYQNYTLDTVGAAEVAGTARLVPYNWKVWWEESLVSEQYFAKLKSAKLFVQYKSAVTIFERYSSDIFIPSAIQQDLQALLDQNHYDQLFTSFINQH